MVAPALPDDGQATPSKAAFDRRAFGAKVAAGAALAWVAPAVISVRAAAATCPPPPDAPPALAVGANTSFGSPALNASTTDLRDGSTPAVTMVFPESGPVTLAQDLVLDRDGTPGTFSPPFAGATLATGTVVYSYLVHARRTTVAGSAVFVGSLQVPPALVVLGFTATTNATQTGVLEGTTLLGRSDITYRYLATNGEGLEAGTGGIPDGVADSVTIGPTDASGTSVSWHLFTGGNFSDEIRLLLGPVPCGPPPP